MKPKINTETLYASILQSAMASAKIEGVVISPENAQQILQKVISKLKTTRS